MVYFTALKNTAVYMMVALIVTAVVMLAAGIAAAVIDTVTQSIPRNLLVIVMLAALAFCLEVRNLRRRKLPNP